MENAVRTAPDFVAQFSAQAAAMSSELSKVKQAQLHKDQQIRQALDGELARVRAASTERAVAIDENKDAQLLQLKNEYKTRKQQIQADRDSKITALQQEQEMLERNAVEQATHAQRQLQLQANAAACSIAQQFQRVNALGSAGAANAPRALAANSQAVPAMPAINITNSSTGRYVAAAADNTPQFVNMAAVQNAATTSQSKAALTTTAATGYGQRATDGAVQALQSKQMPAVHNDGGIVSAVPARNNSDTNSSTVSETAPLTLAAAAAAVVEHVEASRQHTAHNNAAQQPPQVAAATPAAAVAEMPQQVVAQKHTANTTVQADVYSALVAVTRAVLALRNTHTLVLRDEAMLQQCLQNLPYDAAHAFAVIAAQYKPEHKSQFKWFQRFDALHTTYGRTRSPDTEHLPEHCYVLPNTGLVYAENIDMIIDVTALSTSQDAVDKLVAVKYTQGEEMFKQHAILYLISQRVQQQSTGFEVSIDQAFIQQLHTLQQRSGVAAHQLFELKTITRDIRYYAKEQALGFCKQTNVHNNSQLLISHGSGAVLCVYGLHAMATSNSVVDKLRYLSFIGREQPATVADVKQMLATVWPNEVAALMQQVHAVMVADFNEVVRVPTRRELLSKLYSEHRGSVKPGDVKEFATSFKSRLIAEVDGTVAFDKTTSSNHAPLVCKILPLVIKVDKKLQPNPYYAALLSQLKSNSSSSSSKTAVASSSSTTSEDNASATAGNTSGSKRKAANSGNGGIAIGDIMNTQAVVHTNDLSMSADSGNDDDSTSTTANTAKVARV
jgi:hypothetical protein